jgi:hypothetical protein
MHSPLWEAKVCAQYLVAAILTLGRARKAHNVGGAGGTTLAAQGSYL